jgi:hypothetical protein
MPLLDHFHPPLSRRRHWDSFHGAWAEAMARQLNAGLLPPHYVAEARVSIGGRVEIDVGTFTESEAEASVSSGGSAVALWAPPRPAVSAPVNFGALDVVEVQVYNDEEGPRLVAAIELVGPANKDRPSHRRMFVVKCAGYLQEGVGLAVVDVVTQRRAKLHADLLKLLGVSGTGPAGNELFAAAYRIVAAGETKRVEAWPTKLTIGAELPTLPLWITPEFAVPLELEATYLEACTARRIEMGE